MIPPIEREAVSPDVGQFQRCRWVLRFVGLSWLIWCLCAALTTDDRKQSWFVKHPAVQMGLGCVMVGFATSLLTRRRQWAEYARQRAQDGVDRGVFWWGWHASRKSLPYQQAQNTVVGIFLGSIGVMLFWLAIRAL